MQFYTKYKLIDRVIRELSPLDKVDRVSYLDTNQQIRSFINAGHSLALARAKALQGLYTGDEEDNFPSSPVYAVDPLVASKMSDVLQTELNSRIQNRAEFAKSAERSVADEANSAHKSPDEVKEGKP